MWDLPKDNRETGLKYPHYDIKKTASGHTLIFDDTPGSESVTIEHRGGSLMQMQADGKVVFKAAGGVYQAVFGDSNVIVTGRQDITVNGGGSLKVEGDYDVTVAGNMKTTIGGNMETAVAGDSTTAVAGDSEVVVAGNSTEKVGGNSEKLANQMLVAADSNIRMAGGGVSFVSDGGVQVESSTLTHNNVNVGEDHIHGGVMAGSDETDVPE